MSNFTRFGEIRGRFPADPFGSHETFIGAKAYGAVLLDRPALRRMPLTQRYFFDLTDGLTTIQDTAGLVLPSLDVAISQAHEALQEMRYGGEFSSNDEEWTLVIRDAAGETLMMLPVAPPDPPSKMAS